MIIHKKLKSYFLGMLFFLFLISGCKKSTDLKLAGSLNVINASPGITSAKVRTPYAQGYYNVLLGVNYGNNRVFNVPTGEVPVSLMLSSDTTKPFYTTSFNCSAGEIFSYFISGAAGEDIITNKDEIPLRSDSTFGLRFINLSYNSTPVNVTLDVTPNTNEFTSIAYKSLTDFKGYPAKASDPATYNFQVWDNNSNLLASWSITSASFVQRNCTLVFKGVVGGSGLTAPGLFTVKNF